MIQALPEPPALGTMALLCGDGTSLAVGCVTRAVTGPAVGDTGKTCQQPAIAALDTALSGSRQGCRE